MRSFAEWIEETTSRAAVPTYWRKERDWEKELREADVYQTFDPSEWHTLPREWFRKPRQQRKPRRPSIRAQIAAAEKAGKTVTSVTTPDGTMFQFGESAPAEASNPWLADIAKLRKQ